MPRSEWCTKPGSGFRVAIVVSKASVARRLASVRSSFQPTTFRENASQIHELGFQPQFAGLHF